MQVLRMYYPNTLILRVCCPGGKTAFTSAQAEAHQDGAEESAECHERAKAGVTTFQVRSNFADKTCRSQYDMN